MIKWSESGTGVKGKSIDWSSHKDLLNKPKQAESPAPQPVTMPDAITNAQNLFTGKGFQAFGKTIGLPKPVPLNQSRYNPFSSLGGMTQVNTNTGGSTPETAFGAQGTLESIFGAVRVTTDLATLPITLSVAAFDKDITAKDVVSTTMDMAREDAKSGGEASINKAAQGYLEWREVGKYGGEDVKPVDIAVLAGLGFSHMLGDLGFAFAELKGVKQAVKFASQFKKAGSVSKTLPAGSSFTSRGKGVVDLSKDLKLVINKSKNEVKFTGYIRRGSKGEIAKQADEIKAIADEVSKSTGLEISSNIKGSDLILQAPKGSNLSSQAVIKPLTQGTDNFVFAGQESLGKKPQVINTDGPKLDFNAPAMVDKTPSIERQIIKPSGSDPKNFKTAEEYVAVDKEKLLSPGNIKSPEEMKLSLKTKENAELVSNDFQKQLEDSNKRIIKAGDQALTADIIARKDAADALKIIRDIKGELPSKSQLISEWNKANKIADSKAIKLTEDFDINNPNDPMTRKAAFEAETLQGLNDATAGQRIINDTGIDKTVTAIKSTFPKWIPSEFRKSSIVKPVYNHIINGTLPTKKAELSFYNIIKKSFDNFDKVSEEAAREIDVAGIDFAANSKILSDEKAILQQYDKQPARIKSDNKNKTSGGKTKDIKADKGDYVKIERSKNDTDLKAIQTPEQYRLAKAIGPDVDIIMKNSRSFNGYFRSSPSPELAMNRKLYQRKEGETKEDYQLRIGKTLAHEIGHFIDYLPDANLNRGNLIGRLNTLSDFKKNFITEPDVLKERQKLMRKINEINKDEALLDETKAKLVEPYIKELAKLEDKITFNNPIFKEQLTKLTHIWKPWEEGLDPNYDSYRKSAAELYADFVSVLFNDPGLAQKTAPSFYNQFFKSLGKKPEVEKAFLNIQAELMGERTSLMKKRYDLLKNSGKTAAQKFAAVVAARDAIRNKPWYKTLDADLWYQHAKAIKDKNITVENQFELLDRGTNNELMIKLENKVMPIFDTLRKSGLDDNDLDVILKLERIAKDEGRLNVANTKGFDQMTSEEVLNELENIHSKEKAKALYKAAKDFREVLRETQLEFQHLWTPEQLELIKSNKFYAAFNVLFNDSNNVSHFIKTSTGNIDKDFNTVVNTLLRLRSVVSYGTRNNIKLTITEEFAKAGKGDIQKAKVTHTPMKDGTLVRNVAEPPQGWGTVDIKRNGKLESYYFPEDIAKSLNQEAMADLLGPLKLLRAMNKPFKYLYTGPVNIGFQISNFTFRDWGTTSLFFGPEWTRSQLGKSNSGLNIIANNTYRSFISKAVQGAYYIRGFKLALDKNLSKKYSSTMVEMLKNHVVEVDAGGLFQIDSKNMNEQDMAGVKYLLKMWGLIEKGSKLKRIGQTISAITQSLEETSKIAAHMYFKDLGILNERNLVNIRNHVGSPNFWKKGRQAHNISSTYLFYNPIVQGLNNLGVKATIKDAAGKGSRSAFWWRMIRKAVIPTMAIVAAEEGYFGEDIREKVYLMPEYIKSSYIPIPLGITESGKVKYLSFPQDEEARVVQAIFRNILKMAIHSDDKATRNRAVTDILAYTGGQIPSPAPLINIGGKWITTARGGNPYDAFRSQHIFYKGSEDELPFWDKAEIMAKWTLNQNGILKFNVHDRIENRTVEEQTIANIPGLNRFLRIDNRGAYEENAKIMREINERNAIELVRKKKIVNDIVKNIHDDPSYKPNEDILKLVNERVGADATIKEKTKEFKTLLSATQEEYIAAYDSVHYRSMMNQSTEVKEAIAINLWMNDRMDEKEFNEFLIRAVGLGVMSKESLGTILMETQAGNK